MASCKPPKATIESVSRDVAALAKTVHSHATILKCINEKLEKIMATQQELATQLTGVTDRLKKVGTEIAGLQTSVTTLNTKIDELQAVIAAMPTVSPELQAAVDAVDKQAQAVDDAIPDAQVP